MKNLKTGDVISTPAYLIIDHWGIYSGHGTVISNSKRHGKVVEEPLHSFLNGQSFKIIGFLGALNGNDVVARARQFIGHKWHLIQSNCEHFAYYAHGIKPKSHQLLLGAATVALLALIAFR